MTVFLLRLTRAQFLFFRFFDLIQRVGGISEHDMFNTFNMGVGMLVAVDKNDADKALEVLKANGEDAVIIGELVEGNDGVVIE